MNKCQCSLKSCHFCSFESYYCFNNITNIKLQSCQYLQNIFNLVSFKCKKVQICVLMTKWKCNQCNRTKYSSFKNSGPKQSCSWLVPFL